jgi:exopolysaccharide biosynthesis polyprenyl glycosylphosphotransferase
VVLFLNQGKRVTRRHVFLTLVIWLGVALAEFFGVWLRLGWGQAWAAGWADTVAYLGANWLGLVGTLLVYTVVFYAAGMYEPPSHRKNLTFDPLPAVSVAIAALLTVLAFYAKPSAAVGRGVWAISTGLALVFSLWFRRFFLFMAKRGRFRKRAVVLWDGRRSLTELQVLLERAPVPVYHVLGYVYAGGDEREAEVGASPSLGRFEDLPDLVARLDLDALLLALSPEWAPAKMRALRQFRYEGLALHDYVSLSESLVHAIPVSHINDQWLMSVAMNSAAPRVRRAKRALDVAVSLVGLVPGIPLMALAGLLVKLTSKGPVFYAQTRVGLGGKPYTLYKLRTMRQDAETNGAVWAASRDPRVTPVGHWLRKWRIDEIPQLFNILKGEMSLVGPRPERPEFTERLSKVVPFYEERLLVQPGLTGWAQVCFPYAASVEAAGRKLEYDLYYIKNMDLLLDVSILLRTFKTILVGLVHEEDEVPEGAEVGGGEENSPSGGGGREGEKLEQLESLEILEEVKAGPGDAAKGPPG